MHPTTLRCPFTMMAPDPRWHRNTDPLRQDLPTSRRGPEIGRVAVTSVRPMRTVLLVGASSREPQWVLSLMRLTPGAVARGRVATAKSQKQKTEAKEHNDSWD